MIKWKKKKESLFNWLEVKGIVIGSILLVMLAIYMIRWLVVIPYYFSNYVNIGYLGIIIGGFIMFMIANIPVGIISVIFDLDDDELIPIEAIIGIVSVVIVLITYVHIYQGG